MDASISFPFSGFSVSCCTNELSVTNLSSENNFTNIWTESSSHHQSKSEKVRTNVGIYSLALPRVHVTGGQRLVKVTMPNKWWMVMLDFEVWQQLSLSLWLFLAEIIYIYMCMLLDITFWHTTLLPVPTLTLFYIQHTFTANFIPMCSFSWYMETFSIVWSKHILRCAWQACRLCWFLHTFWHITKFVTKYAHLLIHTTTTIHILVRQAKRTEYSLTEGNKPPGFILFKR